MEKINALASMNDDAMWREIRGIALGYGIRLPEATPPAADMDRIRGAIRGASGPNVSEALKIINNYRKGKGNG